MNDSAWYELRCAILYPKRLLQQKSDSELEELYAQFSEQKKITTQCGFAAMFASVVSYSSIVFANTTYQKNIAAYLGVCLVLTGILLITHRTPEMIKAGGMILARREEKLLSRFSNEPSLDTIILKEGDAQLNPQDSERWK